MRTIASLLFVLLGLVITSNSAIADADPGRRSCDGDTRPQVTFVEMQSFDLMRRTQLTLKGKLSVPQGHGCGRASPSQNDLPAVVILHGSSGVDFRGNFYSESLTRVGIATLEIDMWEARGVTGVADRPPLPMSTYPDAFAALAFLSAYSGIDPQRIGVLGFSWGGVMSMATATEGVVAQFGGGQLRFKAHVAHYPICYAYNNPYIPNSQFGSHAGNPLTGAPILVQIGTNDDYDMGTGPCIALRAGLAEAEQALMHVITYDGAYHDWDRLLVPTTGQDPFSHRGEGGLIRLVPNVDDAYHARERVVRFFQHNL